MCPSVELLSFRDEVTGHRRADRSSDVFDRVVASRTTTKATNTNRKTIRTTVVVVSLGVQITRSPTSLVRRSAARLRATGGPLVPGRFGQLDDARGIGLLGRIGEEALKQ